MKSTKRLDERISSASSMFFSVGFIAAKFRQLPYFFFWPILNLVSLSSYLVGYLLWLIACQIQPDFSKPTIPEPRKWYNYPHFKVKHKLAAAIGTIATISCFIAIAVPIIIVPGLWLAAASNLIWCVGEYHKRKNPPYDEEPDYSSARQSTYFKYTRLIAIVSIFTAVSVSVAFMLPASTAFLLLTASGLLGLALTAIAFHYLGNYTFSHYEPDYPKGSYTKLNELGITPSNSNSLSGALEESNDEEDSPPPSPSVEKINHPSEVDQNGSYSPAPEYSACRP